MNSGRFNLRLLGSMPATPDEVFDASYALVQPLIQTVRDIITPQESEYAPDALQKRAIAQELSVFGRLENSEGFSGAQALAKARHREDQVVSSALVKIAEATAAVLPAFPWPYIQHMFKLMAHSLQQNQVLPGDEFFRAYFHSD